MVKYNWNTQHAADGAQIDGSSSRGISTGGYRGKAKSGTAATMAEEAMTVTLSKATVMTAMQVACI